MANKNVHNTTEGNIDFESFLRVKYRNADTLPLLKMLYYPDMKFPATNFVIDHIYPMLRFNKEYMARRGGERFGRLH